MAKRAKIRECAEQQSSQPADDVPVESRSESGEPETIKRKTSRIIWQACSACAQAL